MTEEQLKQWLKVVECHYNHDKTELWACMDEDDIHEFWKINSQGIFDDEGIDCVMKDGYICIDLVPIAEYYGIDLKEIL